MTSQINLSDWMPDRLKARDCNPPEHAPADYCKKLKRGISRLQTAILAQYEEAFPGGGEWIARAVREAEEAAWATPFPSLFFPTLAHLRVSEQMPKA